MKSQSYYESTLFPALREDAEFAAAYLAECLNDENPQVFFQGIKNVAEARGLGVTGLARETGLNRVSLHRMLSDKGNPEWQTLRSILSALGFDLAFTVKQAS